MRACQQCGLSIGDTATFCAVCGTRVDAGEVPAAAIARSCPAPTCALCGRPGPVSSIYTLDLCRDCREQLELLTDRESHSGISITRDVTEEDQRRSAARTVDGRYSTILDGETCDACLAMDDKTTTDIAEADCWTPNPNCTSRDGCRCVVFYEMASLRGGDVEALVGYAAERRTRPTAAVVQEFYAAAQAARDAEAHRFRVASEHVSEAYRLEKTDALRAAALYRQGVAEYLEVNKDPLSVPWIVARIASAFDRLSLVLKREGLPAEALEELDAAAWLGILDRDIGAKAQCAAMKKRRDSLRRVVAKAAHD